MITKRQYIEYLISTPVNFTSTNLADHLEGVSHDVVTDYLQRGIITLLEVERSITSTVFAVIFLTAFVVMSVSHHMGAFGSWGKLN